MLISKREGLPIHKKYIVVLVIVIVLLLYTITTAGASNQKVDYDIGKSVMIYYGKLNDEVITTIKTYKMVVLNPNCANLTRSDIEEIRKGVDQQDPGDDVLVLGYVSIGEDLRTVGLSPEQMKANPRFVGDGTGPWVNPGITSGGGYASWYLDDNDRDGKPDRNGYFGGAFVNAGDPAWFETIKNMSKEKDGVSGLDEILNDFGFDGVFLDTIDTCAPNYFTADDHPNKTRFEWTAPGFANFIKRLHSTYPDRIIVQNRGLFFFDPRQQKHYKYTTRPYINFVFFESYRLDSNGQIMNFENNKYNIVPKLMAEANRPDGFKVLSLGYAGGPAEKISQDTLLGKSAIGYNSLIEDIEESLAAGFRHYITNPSVDLANTFVNDHASLTDLAPPLWSSTFNVSAWPPGEPMPRIGIQEVKEAVAGSGSVTVRWDVALDMNRVGYALYYQDKPFDFEGNPKLTSVTRVVLVPDVGDGYTNGIGPNVYPYQATIKNLTPGQVYYFNIRAFDYSPRANEDNNRVWLKAVIK